VKQTDRIRVGARIAARYARARWLMATKTLPAAVKTLDRQARPSELGLTPEQLARGVDRVLRIGRRPLRCLPRALVLYSLLADDGQDPTLVIGVLETSAIPDAHAWVEIHGVDVGPPPGRSGHSAMASYPLPSAK
jgi:hypothetical protein